MPRRIVIDGAPGSGKTTFFYGRTAEDEPGVLYPSLRDYGFPIVEESITVVAQQMRDDGYAPMNEIGSLVDNILLQEEQRYGAADGPHTYYLDRALPGYVFIEEIFKVPLPASFGALCAQLRYDSPVFIFEPIWGFDMSTSRPRSRQGRLASVEQRRSSHERILAMYQSLAYDTVIVPAFSSLSPTESIRRRLSFVLARTDGG